MLTQETLLKSMYLIAKSFPKFEAHKDKELLMMWYDVFKDEDEILFQTAVKKLIVTFQYQSPTIANLNHVIAELKDFKKVEPGDIYDEINKVIRKYGYYRLEEGYNSLSDLSKKTVDALGGLRTICLSETIMVDRSHALKVAQSYIDRQKTENLLPNSIKKEQLDVKERLLQLTGGIGDG